MFKKDREEENTDLWNKYQKGVQFNYSMDLYDKSDKNHKFYHGNQWENAKIGAIQPITLNIIKMIVKYKVGVVKSNAYEVFFNSDTYETDEERVKVKDLCDYLNRYISRMWERHQVNKKIRACVDDACIDSEGIIYFYEQNGEIVPEQVDKTNIYYGNENDDEIQTQPYIIISFRRTVDEVKEEAKANGMSEEEIEKIVSDSEYAEQSGKDNRNNEISPMCLELLELYKKNGTIWARKSTRMANVMKDTDLKIEMYPIAHLVWERVKGYARGQGEVEYNIANQIEINKTATRIAMAIKMGAFPKLVANSKYIKNIKSLSKVGTTIEVNEFNADDVNKVVSYLRPTQLSGDAYKLQDTLINTTQQLAGAGDSATGNVDPTQASGNAILAVQRAQQQPINEQVEGYKTFIEDIAKIYFEMLKKYCTNGITLTRERKDYENNITIDERYDLKYEELKDLKLVIKIDITPKSPYDKYAMEISLENLLKSNFINFEEYVSVLPEDAVMQKSSLKDILKQREEKEKIFTQLEKQGNALNSAVEQEMIKEEPTENVINNEMAMQEQLNNQVNQEQ